MRKNLTALILILIVSFAALLIQRQHVEADPLMALLAFGQASPAYRPPRGGVPAVVEELRITVLAAARQQRAEIVAAINAETADPATIVSTAGGFIPEADWMAEADAALQYWNDRITALEALAP